MVMVWAYSALQPQEKPISKEFGSPVKEPIKSKPNGPQNVLSDSCCCMPRGSAADIGLLPDEKKKDESL